MLVAASRDAKPSENLLQLRLSLAEAADIDTATDQAIIGNLLRVGNLAGTARIYGRLGLAAAGAPLRVGQSIGWRQTLGLSNGSVRTITRTMCAIAEAEGSKCSFGQAAEESWPAACSSCPAVRAPFKFTIRPGQPRS